MTGSQWLETQGLETQSGAQWLETQEWETQRLQKLRRPSSRICLCVHVGMNEADRGKCIEELHAIKIFLADAH